MTDTRPANCRSRLRDEYKAYPKSSCEGCGRSVLTGLSDECPLGTTDGPTRADPSFNTVCNTITVRTPSEQVRYCIDKLNEQLAPSQAVIDGVALALEQAVPLIKGLEEVRALEVAAEEDPFKIGATVVLKSRGGLPLTINATDGQSVDVLWFDDANHLHSAWINKDALIVKKG